MLFAEPSPSLSNVHDPYQELVYCASPRDVHTVWVAGRPVVSQGRVLGVDLAELLPRARETGGQAGRRRRPGLRARAGRPAP